MEMTRVVENQIPTAAVTINAAVTLTANQPSFGLTRSVLRPADSIVTGFPPFFSAIAAETTFSNVVPGTCS